VFVACEITREGTVKFTTKNKRNEKFEMKRGSLDILKLQFWYLPGNYG
jgi:hypothetical protein